MNNSEYEAFGKRVPSYRLHAGYEALREMNPGLSTEEAMTTVGRMAQHVERDQPFKALSETNLDLTGRYRLLATLCTGGEAEAT